MYDEDEGKVLTGQDGKPYPRPKGNVPPCRMKGVGCDKGTPEDQHVLSEQNRQAYQHWKECRAVGEFPDDPIVRQNAVIIQDVVDAHTRAEEFRRMRLMLGNV